MPRTDLDRAHRSRRDQDRAAPFEPRPVEQRRRTVRLEIHWRRDARVARWTVLVCAVAFEFYEIVRAAR